MRVWLKQTFRAMPLPLFHETSTCSLEVCALMRGSLPRPWGEGGRRPGEGSVADRAVLLGGLRLLATSRSLPYPGRPVRILIKKSPK